MTMGSEGAERAHHELTTVLTWLARTPESQWPKDVSETLQRPLANCGSN
jgi:hypothetical protein